MNNQFFSIYQRSVVLSNGKQEEHYVCCFGNYCICESSDPDIVKKELIKFVKKELIKFVDKQLVL